MSGSRRDYGIEGIELLDDSYTVEQSLIRNKYAAKDRQGRTVLKGKQKIMKMKEEFPFTDGEGNDVFEVKAGGIVDVAGDYTLIDSRTGEEVVVLDNDFSLMKDIWRIRDPDTEAEIAKMESRGALVNLLRGFSSLLDILIPQKYEITDSNDNHVGTIEGQISFRDRYDIEIDDTREVPKEVTIASAMVIDAIQNN